MKRIQENILENISEKTQIIPTHFMRTIKISDIIYLVLQIWQKRNNKMSLYRTWYKHPWAGLVVHNYDNRQPLDIFRWTCRAMGTPASVKLSHSLSTSPRPLIPAYPPPSSPSGTLLPPFSGVGSYSNAFALLLSLKLFGNINKYYMHLIKPHVRFPLSQRSTLSQYSGVKNMYDTAIQNWVKF